jgi:hypothetical protein
MIRLLVIFFLFQVEVATGQSTLKGFVVDEKDSVPMAGCSVFLTNTSMGAVTNKEGYFEIRNIPSGNYEVVATVISYETASYRFSTDQLPRQVKFVMHPKPTVMETVVVGGYVTETWEKWGRTFLEYFIGMSANSKETFIKNKEVLWFRFYKKLHKLEVIAKEPLIIENQALGYQLTYHLQEFEINFKELSNFFSGHVLFTESGGRKVPRKNNMRKRQEAYKGSIMHFIRSLYNGNLEQEGFEVRRMKRLRNTEKDRVRTICNIPLNRVLLAVPRLTGDSSAYYERILAQKDYTDEYDSSLLNSNSLVVNTGTDHKVIAWPDYLAITYKNKLEEQGYLDYYNEKRKPYPIRSLIHLNAEHVIIDKNGNWSPANAIISEWYWSWSEKVGDMLPLDFDPYQTKD